MTYKIILKLFYLLEIYLFRFQVLMFLFSITQRELGVYYILFLTGITEERESKPELFDRLFPVDSFFF